MDRHRYLIPALALLTVWRIALLPTMELSPLEALAGFYSQHSQLWHLEMGPLTPWLVACTQALAGHSELGLRLLAPVLAFVASVCLWRLTRGAFDATVGAWTVVFLQVLPAFNVAAIHMTPATVGLAALCGYVLALRIGLHRVPTWHGSWWAAAGCMAAAVLADWRNVLAWGCTLVFLSSVRRRHHLLRPGWWLITLAAVMPCGMCLLWNVQHGWPHYYGGEAEPVWNGVINLLRWMLLVSPGLLALSAWALSQRQQRPTADHRLLLAFALPFLLMDLGWGPREPWPSMGWPISWALALAWLAQRSIEHAGMTTQRKILLRTAVMTVAAVMSMVMMRTDLLRSCGIHWQVAQSLRTAGGDYRHFLQADPSAHQMGWRRSAGALLAVLQSLPPEERPFILTQEWELAALLDYYLPGDGLELWQPAGHPRIHCLQSVAPVHPLSSYPRYDARLPQEQSYRGRMALYISTRKDAEAPPAEVRQLFQSHELLSVVRLLHGGQELRTLKFFACHEYQPPDL